MKEIKNDNDNMVRLYIEGVQITEDDLDRHEASKSETEPADSQRSIGGIGNYYGDLSVKTEGGKHFWSIFDASGNRDEGHSWEEIPADLFAALNAYEDSKE